jgi:hypothetical protein
VRSGKSQARQLRAAGHRGRQEGFGLAGKDFRCDSDLPVSRAGPDVKKPRNARLVELA